MSPKGIHLNSRRCNLRWTDLTITTLKGADIHGKKQCSAPTGLDRIVPEFHGLHPRLFMVQPAGLNSSTRKPIENVEEPKKTKETEGVVQFLPIILREISALFISFSLSPFYDFLGYSTPEFRLTLACLKGSAQVGGFLLLERASCSTLAVGRLLLITGSEWAH